MSSINDVSIQLSMSKWIEENKLCWKEEWNRRKSIGDKIFSCLSDETSDFYGSSLLGLFDDSSFINLRTSLNLDDCKLKLTEFEVHEKRNFHKFLNIAVDSRIVQLANNDKSADGVWKMYSIAECFDENPNLWPALRVLLEWARSNKIVMSGCQYIMRVFELILLFIEVSLGLPLKITTVKTPITIARLTNWIESEEDGNKCAKTLINFFKLINDQDKHRFIKSRTNPMDQQALIRPEMIEPLRHSCEFALSQFQTSGNLDEFLQLSVISKTVDINKKFLNPKLARDVKQLEHDLVLQVMEKSLKSGVTRYDSLEFSLQVKGNSYQMIISSVNSRDVLRAENALCTIQEKQLNSNIIRNQEKSSYVKNASVIIPEFSYGSNTVMEFTEYSSTNCHSYHVEKLKARFHVQPDKLNVHWKDTEYSRFRRKFIQQIQEYQTLKSLMREDVGKTKGTNTNKWRFFGEMKCKLRIGNHYFMQVADSLINQCETMTLEKVEKTVTTFAALSSMNENRALLRSLNDQQVQVEKNPKKSNDWQKSDLRNAFYVMTTINEEKLQQFAAKHAFEPSDPPPTGFSITASWKQHRNSVQNFKIYTDNFGIPQNIIHRKTKWMSATFKQFDKTELGDVRVFLEVFQKPTEDEKRIDTLPEYIKKESILHPDLVKLIKQVDFDSKDFPSDPLIGSMKNGEWKFSLMRINTCKAMFTNDDGDVLKLNEIRQGKFDAEGKFNYLDKHNELEVDMNMENRSNEDICRDSYDMSLKLFEFVKENCVE